MKTARRSERIKRRVTCELALDGRRYRGIVLDLSESGVFVQTEATPAPGSRLRLRFHDADGAAFEVDASVARRQVAPPQLASVVRGGLGLRVHAPPPSYLDLLARAGEPAAGARAGGAGRSGHGAARPAAAPRPPDPPPGDPFRVRVKQCDGPRSRTVAVRAPSEQEAAKRVLADLGRGWEVLRIERG
jgi:hypothetical protein